MGFTGIFVLIKLITFYYVRGTRQKRLKNNNRKTSNSYKPNGFSCFRFIYFLFISHFLSLSLSFHFPPPPTIFLGGKLSDSIGFRSCNYRNNHLYSCSRNTRIEENKENTMPCKRQLRLSRNVFG